MSYKIVENDVRLLRRILVAYNIGDRKSGKKIEKYLRKKGLKFILPWDQKPGELDNYKGRLPVNEQWLTDHYGGIILPEYNDVIFLNSKWVNPYTLFVRLVSEVPELRELGKIHWIPEAVGSDDKFRPLAEKMHQRYLAGIKNVVRKFFRA